MPRFTLPDPVWADDLVKRPKPDNYWLVPDLFERGDRTIVTGSEGDGKSTLMRQWAVMIASGIHPFTLEPIQRQRVMLLDLENSWIQTKDELEKICTRAGVEVPGKPWLVITPWPEGIDLKSADYETALWAVLDEYPVDIILGGPMYKMLDVSLADEDPSKALASALDRIRVKYDVAMVLEAHQVNETKAYDGKKGGWVKDRRTSPFGSTVWRRWPEFGICLFRDGTLFHWRTPRSTRTWIPKLRYDGDTWLWQPDGRMCRCGKELTGRQVSYCSETCGNAARQAKFRLTGRNA